MHVDDFQGRLTQLRQAKVQNFNVAIAPQHDVLRLDVAMNYSRLVRRRQSAGRLRGYLKRFT